MQLDKLVFQKVSKFSLRSFTGSILVVCVKGKKIPFDRLQKFLPISDAYYSFEKRNAFKSLKPGDHFVVPLPEKLSAKEIIFFFTDVNLAKKDHLDCGLKISKLISSNEFALVCDQKFLSVDFLTGLFLPSYRFEKYKSLSLGINPICTILHRDLKNIDNLSMRVEAICEGVFFARDLTNEPSNYLNTESFAEILVGLKALNIGVRVVDEEELNNIGMNALLSVGKGSHNRPKLIILEWKGKPNSEKRLGLIGKGVMFDSGGISLKPAGGMQEMTGDMGGAGIIAGLFKTIAMRKAKANVIGLLGLVENMPDGNAMKPGDVIKSLKGDTIEVNNTDAEGRLVLADLLWYCQTKFKTAGIIDLATLTGAIEVALGQEYGGLFSNSSQFKEDFMVAASSANEKVWELPLDDCFNSLLNSRVADLKNSGGRLGGAITAAMFLKRFIKRSTSWIHLDVAGVSFKKNSTDISPPGATGWGVRALNKYLEKFYEN